MKRLLLFFLILSQTALAQRGLFRAKPSEFQTGEIAYPRAFVTTLGNTREEGFKQFFDGDLTTNVNMGDEGSRAMSRVQLIFTFPASMEVSLDSIWMADGQHDNANPINAVNGPGKYWTVNPTTYQADTLGRFDGKVSNSGGWKKVKLTQRTRTNEFVIEWIYPIPTEIRFFGKHKPFVSTPFVRNNAPVEMQIGANSYHWNFLKPSGGGVDTTLMRIEQMAHLHRYYFDTQLTLPGEDPTGTKYVLSPTINGAWMGDLSLAELKARKNTVILCIKNLETTSRYLESIRQAVIRWGNNANVPDSAVHMYTGPGFPANVIKKGMGLIRYVQLGNEPNRWWYSDTTYHVNTGLRTDQNPLGYVPPEVLAAAYKKIYDAIKAIDPTMIVVLGGLASHTPAYVMGMKRWCDRYNGGQPVWDAVAYHDYNNENGGQNSGGSPRGVSPYFANYTQNALFMQQALHDMYPDRQFQFFITETGYSIGTKNPQNAGYAIGNRSLQQTVGDWIMQTILESAYAGLSGTMMYQSGDDNAYRNNPDSWQNWDASNGLFFESKDKADPYLKYRRPGGDYMYQMYQLMQGYYFVSRTGVKGGVMTYRFSKAGSADIYALVSATMNGTSVATDFATSGPVTQFSVVDRSDNMATNTLTPVSGKVTLTVTETPIFVKPN